MPLGLPKCGRKPLAAGDAAPVYVPGCPRRLLIVLCPAIGLTPCRGKGGHDVQAMDRRCGTGIFAPFAAHAATEANFGAKTTGDLAELCEATPDNAIGTAAVNFCQGFALGAVLAETQNMAAFRGPKPFCLPNPPPSRNEALGEFVKWARVSPDRMSTTSTDGLFRFLNERYPCPPSR